MLSIPKCQFVTDNFAAPKDLNTSPVPQNAIVLAEDEIIKVEAQGMLAAKNLTMETKMSEGGILQRIKNYLFSGETLFGNEFRALKGGGWLLLEETHPQQIMSCELSEKTRNIVLTQGAYVASSPGIELSTNINGLKGFLKGKGIATVLASFNGEKTAEKVGRVYFGSQSGPIRTIRIQTEEPVIVDNEALVGFTEGLSCTLKRPGDSYKSLLFSGEGFVCEFQGDGLVFTGSDELKNRSNIAHQSANKATEAMIGATVTVSMVGLGCLIFGVDRMLELTQEWLKSR